MRNFCLLILTVLWSFVSIGQNSLDSLSALWYDESLSDSTRSEASLKLIEGYCKEGNQEEANLYYQELYAFTLTKEDNYLKGLTAYTFGIIQKYSGQLDSALISFEKSKEWVQDAKNLRFTIHCDQQRGLVLLKLARFDAAIQAFENVALNAKNLEDPYIEVTALQQISIAYSQQAKYDEAKEVLFNIISICEKSEDEKLERPLVNAYSNLGITYYYQGLHQEATKYWMTTLALAEEKEMLDRQAIVLGNLGNIYASQGDSDKAIELFKRSISIHEELGNEIKMAEALARLGHVTVDLNDFDQAERYFKHSLRLSAKHGMTFNRAMVYSYMSQGYLRNGMKQTALQYADSSYALAKKMRIPFLLSTAAIMSSEAYIATRQYTLAIQFGKEAMSISQANQILAQYKNAALAISTAADSLGQYEFALEMYRVFVTINDSLYGEENKQALLRKEYEYEYEKQALADSLAQNEETLRLELVHQQELQAESRTRNYIMGAGILFLLLAGGGWSRAQFIKKANARLEVERNRAEESERFKQRFLANMSHEIRTPMNAVLGMTELTLDTKLTKKQKLYLEAVKNSSENLLVIINDILDLSKIEQGKLTVEKIPFRIREQVKLVQQTLQFKAEEKGLAFSIEVDAAVPEVVVGDPYRLHQVLLNLTGNAIKFTEKGKVSVSVSQTSEGMLSFNVSDTGIGIPKNKQDQLFESFHQADESTSRKYGGTGLGLSISKDLVELQGGAIQVESGKGQGSVFSFVLPLPKSEEVVSRVNEGSDAATLSGIRILVAEDNKYNQIVIEDTLKNLINGVQLTLVDNGQKALDQVQEAEFDVVLMDAHMPELDGIEATVRIRQLPDEKLKAVPVIALTASVLKEDIQKCLDAGMNDVLPKPFRREELLGVLGKYYTST